MDLYHGYFCRCPPLLATSLLWTCIMAIFVGVHPSWPPACYGPVSWLFLLVSTPPGHQLAMDLYHGYFCWCPPLLATSLLWTCIMAIFVGVHPSWPPACYGPVSWLFLLVSTPPGHQLAMDLYHGYFCWCPLLLATSLLWTCIMAIFVGVHPSWPPACYGPVSWLFLLVSTPPGHQLAMDLYHGYFCWCPPLLATSLLWTCIMAIFVGVHPSWPPACYGPVSWLFL